MPDVPNFSSSARNAGTQIGQFVRIGDADFQFAGLAENGNKITLTGIDVSAFSPKKPISAKVITTGPTAALADVFSSQLGFKAPVIKGNNVNPLAKHINSALSTADLKGKYVFVDFWSSTCIPCIAEFPNLKAAYDKFDRSKFEIVGVLDERDQSVTKRLINEGNMVWPTIVTNVKGTETKGYNISSYPTSYLIDPQGKIIALDLRGEDLMNNLNSLIKIDN
jgi:thiol-disulfide isomerase/thioredoxin